MPCYRTTVPAVPVSASVQIITYPAPIGASLNPNFAVTIGGLSSPVHNVVLNVSRRVYPGGVTAAVVTENAGFTNFDVGVSANALVNIFDRTVTAAAVYPSRLGVTPTVVNTSTVRVPIPTTGKYELQINNSEARPCYLFANPIEVSAPTGPAPGVLWYGPGVHSPGTVTVVSGQTVYLHGSAIVNGRFEATSAANWQIRGRGILQNGPTAILPVRCSAFSLEGITVLRSSSGWSVQVMHSNQYLVDNLKVFSRHQTADGIDTISSTNVEMKNCFIRTYDDPCSINAYDSLRGNIDNVWIHDCVFAPDNGIGGLEIGASMECDFARNIRYERIDLIHPYIHSAISIYNADDADVRDVTYDDIRIENFHGTETNSAWFRFHVTHSGFSHSPYVPGHINNITVNNVTFTNGAHKRTIITGYDATHEVNGVHFHNLLANGVAVTAAVSVGLTTNAFAHDITFDGSASAPPPPPPPAPGTIFWPPGTSEANWTQEQFWGFEGVTGAAPPLPWQLGLRWTNTGFWRSAYAVPGHHWLDGNGNLRLEAVRVTAANRTELAYLITQNDGIPGGGSGRYVTGPGSDGIFVECRADLSQMKAHCAWFAFWMLTNDDGAYDGNLDNGVEVDIMEHVPGCGREGQFHPAVIPGGGVPTFEAPYPYGFYDPPGTFPSGFHNWGLLWTPTRQEFMFDGVTYWTRTSSIPHGQEHDLRLTLEVDDNNIWGGCSLQPFIFNTTASPPRPAVVLVDHAGVWRRKPNVP